MRSPQKYTHCGAAQHSGASCQTVRKGLNEKEKKNKLMKKLGKSSSP